MDGETVDWDIDLNAECWYNELYLGLYVDDAVPVTARLYASPVTLVRSVDVAAAAFAALRTTTTSAASRPEAAVVHHLQAPWYRNLQSVASAARRDDRVKNLSSVK